MLAVIKIAARNFVPAAFNSVSKLLFLPKSVQITVLIYCCRLFVRIEIGYSFSLRVSDLEAFFCLEDYETDMVLREHRVRGASDLDADSVLIEPLHYRDVLFKTGIYAAGFQLLHFLSAADHRNI